MAKETKIDGRQILERLAAAKKDDRGKQSLYLSKGLYADFKEACEAGGSAVSPVLEELMKEFLASLKAPRKS